MTVTQVLSDDVNGSHQVLFTPVTEVALPDSIELTVTVTDPAGNTSTMTAEREKGYTTAVSLPVVATGGAYELQLDVAGETPAGRRFMVNPPLIVIDTPALVEPEPEPEPTPVEPEPEVVEEVTAVTSSTCLLYTSDAADE